MPCRVCRRDYGKGWTAQDEAMRATCRDCAFRERAFAWSREWKPQKGDKVGTVEVVEVVVKKKVKSVKKSVRRKR